MHQRSTPLSARACQDSSGQAASASAALAPADQVVEDGRLGRRVDRIDEGAGLDAGRGHRAGAEQLEMDAVADHPPADALAEIAVGPVGERGDLLRRGGFFEGERIPGVRIRIVEAARRLRRGQLQRERLIVRDLVVRLLPGLGEENAVPAANTGVTAASRVPGESEAGSEIEHAVLHGRRRHARVAGEYVARRRAREQRRLQA